MEDVKWMTTGHGGCGVFALFHPCSFNETDFTPLTHTHTLAQEHRSQDLGTNMHALPRSLAFTLTFTGERDEGGGRERDKDAR